MIYKPENIPAAAFSAYIHSNTRNADRECLVTVVIKIGAENQDGKVYGTTTEEGKAEEREGGRKKEGRRKGGGRDGKGREGKGREGTNEGRKKE